jgi:hypothetical protein
MRILLLVFLLGMGLTACENSDNPGRSSTSQAELSDAEKRAARKKSREVFNLEQIQDPEKLQAISRYLGHSIRSRQVFIADHQYIAAWDYLPDFAVGKLGKEIKRILLVRLRPQEAGNFTNLKATLPPELAELLGAQMAIVYNNKTREDQTEQALTCRVKICAAYWGADSGACELVEVIYFGNDAACEDMCNSDEDCRTTETCIVRQCDPQLGCVTKYFSAFGQECPPDSCNSGEECTTESENKVCYYRVCTGEFCETVSIEIPRNQACPMDECNNNEDCGGMDVSGILDALEDMGTIL